MTSSLAVLVLAVCVLPPLWMEPEITGECTRLALDCACTNLEWTQPPPDSTHGPVQYYEVDRETVSNGTHLTVGTFYQSVDEDGLVTPPFTGWTTLKDSSIPRFGTLYRYRVRGCNAGGCSAFSGTADDRGYPTACFDGDPIREVPCYPGATCKVGGPNGCRP